MKPNSLIPPTNFQRSDVAEYLLSIINDIIHSLVTPQIPDFINLKCNEETKYFFENYYVKLNHEGSLSNINNFRTTLSTYEADILEYMIRKANTEVKVIVGHAGVGKSTLLKYLSHYLWFKDKRLQKHFIPIYLSLSFEREEITKICETGNMFKDLLDKMLYNLTHSFIYKYILDHYKDILPRINLYSVVDRFKGQFSDAEINNISKAGIDEYLKQLDKITYKKLCLEALNDYTKYFLKVNILIDNVDRYNSDVHSLCLQYLSKKIELNYGAICSLRQSTYNKLDNLTHEIRDDYQELTYTIKTVENIFFARIKQSKKRFTINIENKNYNATVVQISKAFIRLLYHHDTLSLLSSVTNYNLDVLFRIFRLMIKSSYFREDLLVSELLKPYIEEKKHKKAPVHLIYSLYLSNHNGSFKTTEEATNCNIINLFSCKYSSILPYRHFVRLHLLALFYREANDDEDWLYVKKRLEIYRKIFGNDINHNNTVTRSIVKLLKAHLLFVKSCIPYTIDENDDYKYRLYDDSLIISNAGRYYFNTLINKIEYLYFIKDDVNWESNVDISPAKTNDSFTFKIIETLSALKILMQYEYEMLDMVSESNSTNSTNLVKLYADNLSPGAIINDYRYSLYTRNIYNKYKNYILYRLEHFKVKYKFFIEDKINKSCDDIDELIKRNSSIEKAFTYH